MMDPGVVLPTTYTAPSCCLVGPTAWTGAPRNRVAKRIIPLMYFRTEDSPSDDISKNQPRSPSLANGRRPDVGNCKPPQCDCCINIWNSTGGAFWPLTVLSFRTVNIIWSSMASHVPASLLPWGPIATLGRTTL